MWVEHLPYLGFYGWNVAHAKLHLNLPAEHKGTFRLSAGTACLLYLCVSVCTVVTEAPVMLRRLLDRRRDRYEEAQEESLG